MCPKGSEVVIGPNEHFPSCSPASLLLARIGADLYTMPYTERRRAGVFRADLSVS
jgi:hypothetical protein